MLHNDQYYQYLSIIFQCIINTVRFNSLLYNYRIQLLNLCFIKLNFTICVTFFNTHKFYSSKYAPTLGILQYRLINQQRSALPLVAYTPECWGNHDARYGILH